MTVFLYTLKSTNENNETHKESHKQAATNTKPHKHEATQTKLRTQSNTNKATNIKQHTKAKKHDASIDDHVMIFNILLRHEEAPNNNE